MSSSRRILVAGATGVIGTRLVAALAASGDRVHGLARSPASAEQVRASGGTPVLADALDRDRVLAAVAETRPEIIVHQLTAIPARQNPRRLGEQFVLTNRLRREATRHLVDAAERYGVRRLVAQSAAFFYRPEGPPVLDESAPLDTGARGAWGDIVRAAAALEDAVLDGRGFVGVVLRYGGLYGPGTVVSPEGFLGELAMKRRLPIVGSGTGLQSFLHVDDAAGATIAVLDRGVGIYNVVDDHPAPAREWIPALAEALGAPPPRRLPAWVVRPFAGATVVHQMTRQRGASNTRIRSDLGWRPEHPDWRTGFTSLAASPRHPTGSERVRA